MVNDTLLFGKPTTTASTTYLPTFSPNVKIVDACPSESVITLELLIICLVELGGVVAIVNNTVAPPTEFSPISLTETVNAESKVFKIFLV